VISECDTKLARYREALEAGTDPTLAARWTAEVQARCAEALSQSREVTGQRRMTKDEIRAMLGPLGPIRDVLADAERKDKAEVYQSLGLKLIYEPGKHLVRAEARLGPHKLGIWSVSEGGLELSTRAPAP
jgi:site-specific DNA recombinase